jgi:hypothetical protein
VTSSSSRTKSPATSASASRSSGCSRITRNTSDPSSMAPGPEFRRRTRRMSGHTGALYLHCNFCKYRNLLKLSFSSLIAHDCIITCVMQSICCCHVLE